MKSKLTLATLLVLVMLLASCGPSPKPDQAEKEKPQKTAASKNTPKSSDQLKEKTASNSNDTNSSDEQPSDQKAPASSELLSPLFDEYCKTEDSELGDKILDSFKNETKIFLSELAEYDQQELILMLVQTKIAESFLDQDTTYSEYLTAAKELELTESEKNILSAIETGAQIISNENR